MTLLDRRSALLAAAGAAAFGELPAAAECGPGTMPVISLPLPYPARESMAPAGDANLWYWDTGGSGTPVVLLHAMSGDGASWGYQRPAFAAAGFRTIGYSRRGFRRSEAGPQTSTATAADDLLALLDHLRIARAHLVATAGGAFVACAFALAHPERVARLVLACTMLGMAPAELAPLQSGAHLAAISALPIDLRELGPSYRAINPKGHAAWVEHQGHAVTGNVRQAYGRPNTLAGIAALRAPTLFLAGGADLLAPPPIMQVFAQRVPGARFAILPEVGHAGYWERPDLFNDCSLRFLRGAGI